MKYTAASDGPQAIKSRHSPSLLERSKPNNKRCCACICEEPSAPSKATHEAGGRSGVSLARWGVVQRWCSLGKPWPWEPVIELVQAQMLVLVPNQGQAQALGAGVQPGKALAVIWPALGAGTGVHPARPWVQALAQHWASTRQSPGHGHRFNSASPGSGGR